MHEQTYTDWHGYILDVESTDRLEDSLMPMNRNLSCTVLKEKFNYYQIKNTDEELREAVGWILKPPPWCHAYGFFPANYRPSYKLLELVFESFDRKTNVIYFGANRYGSITTKPFGLFQIPFVKRDIIEHSKISLIQNSADSIGINIAHSDIGVKFITNQAYSKFF